MDLALNELERLICHKAQTTNQLTATRMLFYSLKDAFLQPVEKCNGIEENGLKDLGDEH